MRIPARLIAQRQLVSTWQDKPIGTAVTVRKDNGELFDTVTRSVPWMLGEHTAVIMVEGISGCYSLERITVRS